MFLHFQKAGVFTMSIWGLVRVSRGGLVQRPTFSRVFGFGETQDMSLLQPRQPKWHRCLQLHWNHPLCLHQAHRQRRRLYVANAVGALSRTSLSSRLIATLVFKPTYRGCKRNLLERVLPVLQSQPSLHQTKELSLQSLSVSLFTALSAMVS